MSDRDVKKIWEAVISERNYETHPVPDPSREWVTIIQNYGDRSDPRSHNLLSGQRRPLRQFDANEIVEYFLDLEPEKFSVVQDELEKLADLSDYTDRTVFQKKLGFDLSWNYFSLAHLLAFLKQKVAEKIVGDTPRMRLRRLLSTNL